MYFVLFLSLAVLAATVFVLSKGKPNLFMFQLVENIFGEHQKERGR